MQIISTTELRTKSKKLVASLKQGETVDLVHRSEVIGEIRPKISEPKPFDPEKFLKLVSSLNLPKLSDEEIEENYRQHLVKKYGKGIS